MPRYAHAPAYKRARCRILPQRWEHVRAVDQHAKPTIGGDLFLESRTFSGTKFLRGNCLAVVFSNHHHTRKQASDQQQPVKGLNDRMQWVPQVVFNTILKFSVNRCLVGPEGQRREKSN